MATEIELKLYCLPEDIARIEAHPLIAEGKLQGPSMRLENSYFDTPELTLHARKIALRLRNTPTQALQTVKCAGESIAGLSSRPEWENPFLGHFDFTPVDHPNVRAFLEEHQAALQPIFKTDFERKTWKITLSKRVSFWVMVDVGKVSSGDLVLPISEVELELIDGTAEDLLDFATALATDLPLVPNNVSKAERGYQLFLNRSPCAARALPSPVTAELKPIEAFQALAQQGMLMWQTNQLGILTVNSPEFVHQFRVALRRLGSVLKIFKPALPAEFHRHWTERLKALSQVTGDIRNLDVMRETVLRPLVQSSVPTEVVLAETLIAACGSAQQNAQRNVERLRYGGLALEFAKALRTLPADTFPGNLKRFAEKRLSALHRRARKALRRATPATTPENAHRLRIALKHLRYSCEFLAPLFDEAEMLQYAKAMADLQDELGFVNDIHVALAEVQAWIREGLVLSAARDCVAAWHSPRVGKTLKRALPVAEESLGHCLPWCSECERRGMDAGHGRRNR